MIHETAQPILEDFAENHKLQYEIKLLRELLGNDLPHASFFEKYRTKEEWFARKSHGDHGVDHSTRVLVFSELISRLIQKQGNEVKYDEETRWAASTHDTRRIGEGFGWNHGQYSAEWILEKYADVIPEQESSLTVNVETVAYLNRWHEPDDHRAPEMTLELKILKDSDALDRVRVGMLNKDFLRTKQSQGMVEIAYGLYALSYELQSEEGMNGYDAVINAAVMMGIINNGIEEKETNTTRETDQKKEEEEETKKKERKKTKNPSIRSKDELEVMLSFMRYVAVKSGKIIMENRGKNGNTKRKGDYSIVTQADLRVRDFLLETISRRYPNVALLTEESKDTLQRLDYDQVFIADELDGSGNYSRGGKDFCFMLGYTEKGVPKAGVICDPIKGEIYFARKKGKAYVATGPDAVKINPLPSLKDVSLTWEDMKIGHPRNHGGRRYGTIYEQLGIDRNKVVLSGSMGTRMLHVINQETHAIIGYTRQLKEWDTVAGHVILNALGVSVTDVDGQSLEYNKRNPHTENGILIVHPAIKDEFFRKWKAVKQQYERAFLAGIE